MAVLRKLCRLVGSPQNRARSGIVCLLLIFFSYCYLSYLTLEVNGPSDSEVDEWIGKLSENCEGCMDRYLDSNDRQLDSNDRQKVARRDILKQAEWRTHQVKKARRAIKNLLNGRMELQPKNNLVSSVDRNKSSFYTTSSSRPTPPTNIKPRVSEEEQHFSHPNTSEENGRNKNSTNECVDYHITPKFPSKMVAKVQCKPHRSSPSDCRYANRVYKRDDTLKQCGASHRVDICHRTKGNEYSYQCSMKDCAKLKRANVTIFRPVQGGKRLVRTRVYTDKNSLSKAVGRYARQVCSLFFIRNHFLKYF